MAAIFKCIFLNGNLLIAIKISLRFVPKGAINNIPAFRWWFGADQATSHCLNRWWLGYWRIYASLGLNELIPTLSSLVVPQVVTNSGAISDDMRWQLCFQWIVTSFVTASAKPKLYENQYLLPRTLPAILFVTCGATYSVIHVLCKCILPAVALYTVCSSVAVWKSPKLSHAIWRQRAWSLLVQVFT